MGSKRMGKKKEEWERKQEGKGKIKGEEEGKGKGKIKGEEEGKGKGKEKIKGQSRWEWGRWLFKEENLKESEIDRERIYRFIGKKKR